MKYKYIMLNNNKKVIVDKYRKYDIICMKFRKMKNIIN